MAERLTRVTIKLAELLQRVWDGHTPLHSEEPVSRYILATVNHAHKDMEAATVRTTYAQPDADATGRSCMRSSPCSTRASPKAPETLAGAGAGAGADVTAYASFPRNHWPTIASTNSDGTDQQRS